MAVRCEGGVGLRLVLEPDTMVRLYWRGTPVVSMPPRVTYPREGVSLLDLRRDNLGISWMNTRLFCGMLLRLPGWLLRKVFGNHT